MLWALIDKFSKKSCQKNNYSLRTRRDLGKATVLAESTLNFAYIHIKSSFLKNFNFFLKWYSITLNFQQKLWKIREFIFRRCNFTKNELFLRYYFRILFSEDLFYHGTSMLLQNTSLYICSNSKYVVHGLFKIIQNYVNNKINN